MEKYEEMVRVYSGLETLSNEEIQKRIDVIRLMQSRREDVNAIAEMKKELKDEEFRKLEEYLEAYEKRDTRYMSDVDTYNKVKEKYLQMQGDRKKIEEDIQERRGKIAKIEEDQVQLYSSYDKMGDAEIEKEAQKMSAYKKVREPLEYAKHRIDEEKAKQKANIEEIETKIAEQQEELSKLTDASQRVKDKINMRTGKRYDLPRDAKKEELIVIKNRVHIRGGRRYASTRDAKMGQLRVKINVLKRELDEAKKVYENGDSKIIKETEKAVEFMSNGTNWESISKMSESELFEMLGKEEKASETAEPAPEVAEQAPETAESAPEVEQDGAEESEPEPEQEPGKETEQEISAREKLESTLTPSEPFEIKTSSSSKDKEYEELTDNEINKIIEDEVNKIKEELNNAKTEREKLESTLTPSELFAIKTALASKDKEYEELTDDEINKIMEEYNKAKAEHSDDWDKAYIRECAKAVKKAIKDEPERNNRTNMERIPNEPEGMGGYYRTENDNIPETPVNEENKESKPEDKENDEEKEETNNVMAEIVDKIGTRNAILLREGLFELGLDDKTIKDKKDQIIEQYDKLMDSVPKTNAYINLKLTIKNWRKILHDAGIEENSKEEITSKGKLEKLLSEDGYNGFYKGILDRGVAFEGKNREDLSDEEYDNVWEEYRGKMLEKVDNGMEYEDALKLILSEEEWKNILESSLRAQTNAEKKRAEIRARDKRINAKMEAYKEANGKYPTGLTKFMIKHEKFAEAVEKIKAMFKKREEIEENTNPETDEQSRAEEFRRGLQEEAQNKQQNQEQSKNTEHTHIQSQTQSQGTQEKGGESAER